MLKINKVVVAILMISVFTIGPISFADTVNAAVESTVDENKDYTIESREKSVKWKKFESGSINTKNPDKGYKNRLAYNSFSKGSNEIKVNFIGTRIKNNEKVHVFTVFFSKKGNNVEYKLVDYRKKPPKTDKDTVKTKYSVKTIYKSFLNDMKKG